MVKEYIAHRDQALITHLEEVGDIAAELAAKIGIEQSGELIGLLHDFGKFSDEFQSYIKSAIGEIRPEHEDYVDFDGLKGQIDHSSAGAQWIWESAQKWGKSGQLAGQIMALCVASHHSGLIDCLKPDGESAFLKRMRKPLKKTHKNECLGSAPKDYLKKLEKLAGKELFTNMLQEQGWWLV